MPALLTLLHSNDLHSRLEPWTRLVTCLRRTRLEAQAGGRAVLYLDAGDHGDRSIPATDALEARINFDLLAAAGCDAMTAGNNEMLVWSWAVQSQRASAAPFPVLMANVRRADGRSIPGYADYTVLTAGDLKAGVFGLAPPFRDFLHLMDAQCLPTDATVHRCVAALRAEGCDLIVFLSHLGIGEDRRIAAADMGIDVIVGGHTHTELPEGERYGRTLVVQTGCYGTWLGRLDLTVEPAVGGAHILDWQARLMPTADETPDPETAAAVARAEAEAARIQALPILHLPQALAHNPFGPSPLASLLATYQRSHFDADCALVQGAVLLDGLPAGPVSAGDLGRICPNMLNPAWSHVPGRLLLRWLEQSADPAVTEAPIRGAGMRGTSPMGTLFGAGITWQVDPTQPVGQRISGVRIAGLALDPSRTYKVACNDFLVFGWYGYTGGRDAGLRLDGCDVDDFMRHTLRAALLAAFPQG